MFQHCVMLKVSLGEVLATDRTLGSAMASVNVVHYGIMIVAVTTNLTFHGLNHVL